MSHGVATKYAKALLGLMKQKGLHNQALEQLSAINKSLQGNHQIKAYFDNPVIKPEQKVQALKSAFGSQKFIEEVVSVVLLMTRRGRISMMKEFVEAMQSGLDQENGVTRGTVRAAKPLSVDAQADLEKKITQVLKKKIVLTFKEDPTLLGGVVAQVGGWTFDDSIESHLKRMNEELNRRAH